MLMLSNVMPQFDHVTQNLSRLTSCVQLSGLSNIKQQQEKTTETRTGGEAAKLPELDSSGFFITTTRPHTTSL